MRFTLSPKCHELQVRATGSRNYNYRKPGLGRDTRFPETDTHSTTDGETLVLGQQLCVNFSLGFPETMRALWEAKVVTVSGALQLKVEKEIIVLQRKISPV